jgi:hypothetical protein
MFVSVLIIKYFFHLQTQINSEEKAMKLDLNVIRKQAEAKKHAFTHKNFRGLETLKSRMVSGGVSTIFRHEGLELHAFKSDKAGKYATYLPQAIVRGRERLWSFSDEKKEGSNMRAYLLSHCEGFEVVAVVENFQEVAKVIPLDELEHKHVKRNPEKLAELRLEAACCLGILKTHVEKQEHKEMKIAS